jgi:hypothetical protein
MTTKAAIIELLIILKGNRTITEYQEREVLRALEREGKRG